MIASEPVNLFVLDSDEKSVYESGGEFSAFAWRRKSHLEEQVFVEPGTWYIIVEGRDAPSTGRIWVYQ
jgi:hypothetical protein